MLVASHQDAYVPMHSAQIMIPRPAELDKQGEGPMFIEMATNLLSPIMANQAAAGGGGDAGGGGGGGEEGSGASRKKPTQVVRLTLDQKFTSTTMDTVIGRAAHVAMLDSPAVVLLDLFSLYVALESPRTTQRNETSDERRVLWDALSLTRRSCCSLVGLFRLTHRCCSFCRYRILR